jgi:hypothetical protein
MPRSITHWTTLPKIAVQDELGVALVQLMMVCNDLTLCNHALEAWKDETDGKLECRKIGAGMYFIRLMMAHMLEAMEIVKRLSRPPLVEFVEAMDFRSCSAFDKTAAFINSPDYMKMKRIRDKLTFHYDSDVVRRILKNLSPGQKALNLEVTLSDDLSQWYFAPSDRVIDQFVVRNVFEVPHGANIRKEVDRIVDQLQGHIENLGDFAGYFIRKYTFG